MHLDSNQHLSKWNQLVIVSGVSYCEYKDINSLQTIMFIVYCDAKEGCPSEL